MALPETTDQFQVISQRPAPAGEIFRAARTDVDAENLLPGKFLPGDEFRRPVLLVGVKKISHSCRGSNVLPSLHESSGQNCFQHLCRV